MRATKVGLGLLLLLVSPGAKADPVADFYKGRQVELLIGMTQGAAYDIDARLVARHIARYIPGNPVVVPKQMTGAGSVRAAMYVANVAAHDGSVLLAPHQGLPLQQALKDPALKTDMTAFNWIGTPVQENNILFTWHTSGIVSLEDARKRDVVIGASGVASSSAQYPQILNTIAGTRFKVIAGYPGGADVDIAMERGEVAGRGSANWDAMKMRPTWLAEHKIHVLVQIGLTKPADLTEPPLLTNLARNKAERAALYLLSAPAAVGHPLLLGPGVPKDRVEAIRKAFDATMKDPQFLRDAAAVSRDIRPMPGVELQALVERIVTADKSTVDTLTNLIGDISR